MKNIFTILKRDLRGLFKNFLALVVAGGLCLLPALYAWFNIYANWDPYANTGNIDIVVVNLDEGWTKEDGTHSNMGDSLVESLKEKDSIHWVFLNTEEEAVSGIESGTYYAAVVIDSEFTYGMYNGVAEGVTNPKLTYYVNGKKNAVATKITDSAVSSIQASVNKAFVQVLAEQIFVETNSLADEMESKDSVEVFIAKLQEVSDKLGSYENLMDDFISGNVELAGKSRDTEGSMDSANEKLKSSSGKLDEAGSKLDSTRQSFNDFSGNLNGSLTKIQSSLIQLQQDVEAANFESDVIKIQDDIQAIADDAEEMAKHLDVIKDVVRGLKDELPEHEFESLNEAIDNMRAIVGDLVGIRDGIDISKMVGATMDTISQSLSLYSEMIGSLNTIYTEELVPQMNKMLDGMEITLSAASSLLDSLSESTTAMGSMFSEMGNTLDLLNGSLSDLKVVFGDAKEKVDQLLAMLENATDEEKLELILNFMMGDPEKLGQFFAEPVLVENHYVYEIANYGSGVAPFYTTLAIWVGMTILVSLIKVHAEGADLIGVRRSQLFLGRYLIFFLMSQIQTLIIVLGDLFLLGVQCKHPFLFWVASAMTSLTFSLLVYSLTIAFGDIGKAFAVVIMVIQIAGSGGTFPIESLPGFFQAVYIFFPFPYAINAMRECIGGMYGADFGIYIMRLGFFCAGALVIGLVIRIPFIGLNHFIEERMEDTDLM